MEALKRILTPGTVISYLLIAVVACLFRLLWLLGDHVIVDGDESILGLMTTHLLEGRGVPVYFYGQQYGFSLIEVLLIAPGQAIFGAGTWVIKIPMLLFWSLGVWFFLKAVYRVLDRKDLAWLITLILLALPAWLAWSTKARGGYVTAFVAVMFLLDYALAIQKVGWKQALVIGSTLALIAVSQALWLAGLAPVLIVILWRKSTWATRFGLGAFSLGVFFLLRLPLLDAPISYTPKIFEWMGGTYLPRLYTWLEGAFSGYYLFDWSIEVPMPLKVFTWLFWGLVVALFVRRLFIRRASELPSHLWIAAAVAVLLSIAYFFFLRGPVSRYFLPVTFWMLWWGMTMIPKEKIRWVRGTIIALLIVAVPALVSFRDLPATWMEKHLDDRVVMGAFMAEIEARDIEYVYCTDAMMQWQLNYLSEEKLTARYQSHRDRYPLYPDRVDSAFFAGTPTAVVGLKGMCLGMDSVPGWHESVEYIGDRYFIFMEPEASRLEKGGFELENDSSAPRP